MELRRQLATLRAWLWLFLASVLLGGGAAFLVSSIALQRIYEGTTTLIVGQSLTAVNPDINQLLASQRLSQTYAQVATTRSLLEQVVGQLGLQTTPEVLAGVVDVKAPSDSTLIRITARDPDPNRAADIANAIATQLIAASPAIQGRQADTQQSVGADLQATRQQIQDAQSEVNRLSGLPGRTPAQEQQLQTLRSELVGLRSTYATLLAFSSNSASNLLSVVDPAVPATAPASPRVLLNTLVAALVGLLIAIGVAFLVEYLDDTVKNPEDVEEVTRLPTLGTIARMHTDRKRGHPARLVSLVDSRSSVAEAFRTLRTNLEFATLDAPLRTLLVTSAVPGEGKTTIAANLAIVFAQAGKRTLLLDADLRKPGLHLAFDLGNERGLTTLLRSDSGALSSAVNTTQLDNLRVLTTGPLPPNPADLLGSLRMKALLERLAGECDIVVVDSPPLQAVTDAAILASLTDGTLFVIDSQRTRRGAVRQGRMALERAAARVLGASLNRLSDRTRGENYSYYGSYGAYYGSTSATKAGRTAERSPAPETVAPK